MKIALIGAGGYGTAIAKVLADNGHEAVLWSYEKEVEDDINLKHINSKYLPGIIVPENVKSTGSMEKAIKDSKIVIMISPSQFTDKLTKDIKPFLTNQVVACMAKGFATVNDKPELLLNVMKKHLSGDLVYVAGPTHAEELGKGIYSGLVASSVSIENAKKLQDALSNDYLTVYTSNDPIGAQVAAATKNVIAIIYGILDGLKDNNPKFGDNTESYIYARGLIEIYKVAKVFGNAKIDTLMGLGGAGDLLVTCSSIHGRNRRFGNEIVSKNLMDECDDINSLLKKLNYLPEGAFAIQHVMKLKEIHGLELPLMEALWRILSKQGSPEEIIEEYLSREISHGEHD